MGKRMTKHLAGLALLVLLAGLCVPALAGNTLMNVYIEKETLNEEEAARKAICSKNGELRVTRQSVYPWDEEGSRWSVFVELENTSDGPIVMDETWLYTCKADKETAVFVEPRVVVANFREPYVNVNREASFTETSAMIQAGFRVCAANRKERASWGKYIFVPHFFTGLQVGGLKHMRSVNTVGDFALNYSGKFYLGYHLSRFATLKAAIEYETLNENKYDTYVVDFMGVEKQFTALWRYRYRFLNFKLAYMLNLSNIYQRYDLKRKFNFYVEAGALYTKCQSDGAEIYSGELEVGENPRPMSGKMSSGAPAALLGAVAQYRFNDQWSLIIEPEVHYYLRKDFIGGEVLSPFNDVVAKVSVGASYTF